MIGQIKGVVEYKGERTALVSAADIGYEVSVPAPTLAKLKIGGQYRLWTYLAVREDALDLYGFLERRELEFFKLLITVSGIGPKSALTILSLAPPQTLERAVAAGEVGYLTKISGIGPKSAQKIVLELKDKIAVLSNEQTGTLREESEALEALRALGYGLNESRRALQQIEDSVKDTVSKVKAALKILSKKNDQGGA